ncbi:type I-E CRISPR-associated protein Cas5/CasD [Stratiformator vulcanicus]|uniref:CRISPR system Cascade subunit CasD n=1 Tax=Stratiformator vulcanicus TaxID=2527980 RepID=A0A517R168_9PLAN|nr:type I-E CRISPR-associated protein Cas5/CasD [Stratiformator vulcanicus]QDT37590.1 CRISPR system Cascade subunit CasD [Stratiformator vulcanicus]
MSILILRLTGPLQSWGTQSRFTVRDTGREPSKSGMIGILCAALGMDRTATELTYAGRTITFGELTSLKMGVRINKAGQLLRDFHTAGGGTLSGKRNGPSYGVVKASGKPGDTVLSNRFYLADADFLVGLMGADDLMELLREAVKAPHWPLFLGRKSCPPGEPLLPEINPIVPGNSLDELMAVLTTPPKGIQLRACNLEECRIVIDVDDAGAATGTRIDVPRFNFAARKFRPRNIASRMIVPSISAQE